MFIISEIFKKTSLPPLLQQNLNLYPSYASNINTQTIYNDLYARTLSLCIVYRLLQAMDGCNSPTHSCDSDVTRADTDTQMFSAALYNHRVRASLETHLPYIFHS